MYPRLVSVDMSAPEGAEVIQHYTVDYVGEPAWLANRANDIPIIEVLSEKLAVSVRELAGAYRITMQEARQAAFVGRAVQDEKATGVRDTIERTIDDIVLFGRSDVSPVWDGLINTSGVTKEDVAATGTGSSTLWSTKTAQQIALDVNTSMAKMYEGSKGIEVADTLGLPLGVIGDLTSQVFSGTSMTALQFLRESNVYTTTTGRPLNIVAIRGLENAAASSGNRFIIYKNDPDVVRLHMPKALSFYDGIVTDLEMTRAGTVRLGGLEIRRPGAIRYGDLI